MTAARRPIVLRAFSLVHRVAHTLSGGRVGTLDPGAQAPKGRVLKTITTVHRTLYSLTGGIIGGNAGGLETLLLTTIGRKTGQRRTVPLPFFRDGDRVLVVASNAAGEANPAWYSNLLKTPEVVVQIGREKQRAIATTATPEERARLWPIIVAGAPMYAEYERTTDRPIPLVVMTPERRSRR
jgi:F420H(2)-dependent quinone reductase